MGQYACDSSQLSNLRHLLHLRDGFRKLHSLLSSGSDYERPDTKPDTLESPGCGTRPGFQQQPFPGSRDGADCVVVDFVQLAAIVDSKIADVLEEEIPAEGETSVE